MKQLFLLVILILCTSSSLAKSTVFTKERRAQIQQRRERVLKNGDIKTVYPRKFKIDWFVVNNRAYMGIFWEN